MKTYMLIGASIAALTVIPALAQPTPPSPPAAPHAMHMAHGGWDQPKTRAEVEAKIAERFAKADTNNDGAVSKQEFEARAAAAKAEMQAKMAEMHAKMFDRLDADRNGQVSRAEWDAHHASMKAQFEERRETTEKNGKRVEKRVMAMGGGDGHKGMRMMRHRGGWGEHWFETSDANKDGRVTLAEAKTKALAHFDKVDPNKDGTISPEERKAAHEAMREEWRAKRGS